MLLEKAFEGAPVLVAGGYGFIGSNLVRRLVRLGARVTVVDALVPNTGANRFNLSDLEGLITVHVVNMVDEEAMRELMRGRTLVFNLAGQVSHVYSMCDPYADLTMNCHAQLGLLEACRKHAPGAKIVFTATRQQYGRPEYLPVDEGHPLRPIDINGIHKVAAEAYHLLYGRLYGLHVTSLRLTNTYGPGQLMRNGRHAFVPWLIRLAIDGQQLQIFGDGQQTRDFIYVKDVVAANAFFALESKATGVFNVACGRPITVTDLALTIRQLTKSGSTTDYGPDRPGDLKHSVASIDKMHTAGFRPVCDLAGGLRATIEFFSKDMVGIGRGRHL